MKKAICIVTLVVTISSCYYDIEEQLYPQNGNCDVSGVTFSATVVPLLQNNGCISCHSGGAPSGNISLEGYNNVKTLATNGKLFGTISHSSGYSPMPQGGNKMTNCNINKIKAWIDAGSPNN
jgi:hypothetical protein